MSRAPQGRRWIDHLRRIKDVSLSVWVTNAKGFSETKDLDVELKLRQSGLHVTSVPNSDVFDSELLKGRPGLLLMIVDIVAGGRRTVQVKMVLFEAVRPVREPKFVFHLETWNSQDLRKEGEEKSATWPADIRRMVNQVVDEFVNDYLSVNSK